MKNDRKPGNYLKKFIIIFLATIVGFTALLAFYFFRTDAPITDGNVVLHELYKDELSLDIYLPTGETVAKSPTILFIHGGAWIAGTNKSINFNRFNKAINDLRSKGYTVVSPEYTLAKNDVSPFPQCIEDIYEAAHWISENAELYNLDLNRFGVFGESAGAHLALMLAYADPADFNLDLDIPDIKYVIDVYGPTDLYSLYHSSTIDSINQFIEKLPGSLGQRLDLSKRLFGFDPELDSARTEQFTRKYSPVKYLGESGPPTLVIHGEDDQLVPVGQSQILINDLELLGLPYEYYTLPAVNHGFIGATKEQKAMIQRWVYEFIMNYTQ